MLYIHIRTYTCCRSQVHIRTYILHININTYLYCTVYLYRQYRCMYNIGIYIWYYLPLSASFRKYWGLSDQPRDANMPKNSEIPTTRFQKLVVSMAFNFLNRGKNSRQVKDRVFNMSTFVHRDSFMVSYSKWSKGKNGYTCQSLG